MDPAGLVAVRSAVAAAATRVGVSPDAITIVAVSKGRSDADVSSVVQAGQLILGENRQQGLRDRIASRLFPQVEWHFVGPLDLVERRNYSGADPVQPRRRTPEVGLRSG